MQGKWPPFPSEQAGSLKPPRAEQRPTWEAGINEQNLLETSGLPVKTVRCGGVWRARMPRCQSAAAPSVPHVPHSSQGLSSSVPAASPVWPHGVPESLTPTPSVPQAEQRLNSHRAEGSGL